MRPDVAWKLPDHGSAGRPLEIEVTLAHDGGTKLDALSVALLCEVMHEDGALATTEVDRVQLESEEKVVPDGTTYRARLTVPEDARGTSALAGVMWWIAVQASIPWWPDLDERTTIRIEGSRTDGPVPSDAPAAAIVPRKSVRTVPRPARQLLHERIVTPAGITAEIALEDRAFGAGDHVTGVVAVSGTVGHDFHTLELEVGRDVVRQLENGHRWIEFVSCGALFAHLGAVIDGHPMEIAGRIAGEVVTGKTYFLRVHLEYDETGDATYERVPVLVDAYEPRTDRAPPLPPVGRARWKMAWQQVADAHGLELDAERLIARATLHDLPVEIALEPERVRATIRWPSLGLDLRLERNEGVSFHKPDVGSEAFRHAWRMHARDREQACAFLRGALIDRLEALELRALDDGVLEIASDAARGWSAEALEELVQELEALCAAASRAIASMPPPSTTEACVAGWRRFAQEHDARLDLARLAVSGVRRDAGSLALSTRFGDDGLPQGTTLSLLTERTLSGDAPAELAAKIGRGALQVSPHRLDVELPTNVLDPASLDDTTIVLEQIAQALAVDGPHGPYR